MPLLKTDAVLSILGGGLILRHVNNRHKHQEDNKSRPKIVPRFVQSLCASSLSIVSAVWGQERTTRDQPTSKLNTFVTSCEPKTAMNPKNIILVTGGSGFLGQHVVKLIQEKCEEVDEIRVFDLKPYDKNIEHTSIKPVRSYVGDITKASDINEAVKGVNSVIHVAGLVSFGTSPDFKGMERVNVQGTANVIEACISQNVNSLVFTSTVDVVIGYDDLVNANETIPTPKKFLFPGYPITKLKAEKMVLAANGTELAKGDGSKLHTISLRPNVMYGEGDPYFIPAALKQAQTNCGTLPRVGTGKSLFQQAYVGNVAWAHIKAIKSLQKNPSASGGRAYFITDDTPLCNSFEFMDNFLRARGFKLSKYSLPYPLVYGMLYMMELFIMVLSPIYKINISTALCSIMYINKTFYFSRKLAEQTIDYQPLYTYKEALENSTPFYVDLKL